MRAQYLAEQADVDGEPELAKTLRTIADRNQGLAHGLYALVAEESATADTRPGANDLLDRLSVEAATYESLAAEVSQTGRADLAEWLRRLSAAQIENEQQLADACYWRKDPA